MTRVLWSFFVTLITYYIQKYCILGTTVCSLCSLALIIFCIYFLKVFPTLRVCVCVCMCECVLCVGTASVPVTEARRLRQSPYGLDGVCVCVS